MSCNFSPIAFSIFGLNIHWYSLAYIFGLLAAWKIAERLSEKEGIFSKELLSEFVNYAVLGIVFGGRLGHVLFYEFDFYMNNPQDIVAVWKGGMSFYGGFLGVVASTLFFCKKHKIDFLKFIDLWAVSVPIGLFFGRIANFINMELPGRVTTVSWAVKFHDQLPRHPSQLYEAATEGAILFLIMLFAVKHDAYKNRGYLSSIFCIGYGVARFTCEFFREPDSDFSYYLLAHTALNLNQYLSIAIICVGIYIMKGAKHAKPVTAAN